MRRFDYEQNDEYREDVDNFFGGEENNASLELPVELKNMLEEEQAMQQLQLHFAYREINHRILRTAIKVCERSFWWRFRSLNTRLKMIATAYKKLKRLEEK